MSEEKIPTPPLTPSVTLKKSIKFWGSIVNSLDKQMEFMEDNHCYGKIMVEFKFWNGKLTDKGTTVVVNDRVVSDVKI